MKVSLYLFLLALALKMDPSSSDPEQVHLPGGTSINNVDDTDTSSPTESPPASACPSVPVYVYQEGSDIQLGQVLTTDQTVEEFYGYRDRTFSEHALVAPFMGGKTTLLTIHQDSRSCELSLVIVNSKAGEGDFFATINMYITGSLWNPLVQDDPEYVNIFFNDDEYDSIFFRRDDMTNIRWFWGRDETDGMANPLPSSEWSGCIEVDAEFVDSGEDPFRESPIYGHMDNWNFVSGSDDGSSSAISLERGERWGQVFLCLGEVPNQERLNEGENESDPFPEECDESTRVQGFCGYCERNLCHWHILCNGARFLNCNFGTNFTLW